VKGNVPVCVGVPESRPAEVSVKPGGGAPAVTANVTVPVPPVAVRMTGPYDRPAVPAASVVGLMDSGAAGNANFMMNAF